MTAPNGAILFNNSTGSDTTASGLGSANVYGSGASTTGSSAVVTGIDTTGVSSGDLLWVQSSSGRQFSIIATVDSSTQVTCDDVFANTESGRTWAIGGKRATFDGSLSLFLDELGEQATIELETDQTISNNIYWKEETSYIGVSIKSSEAGVKRTITQTADSTTIFSFDASWNVESDILLQDIKFVNTSSVKSHCINIPGTTGHAHIILIRCQVGDTGSGFSRGYRGENYQSCHAYDTVFKDCIAGMEPRGGTNWASIIDGCWFDNCDYGINAASEAASLAKRPTVFNSVFSNCSTAIHFNEYAPAKTWIPYSIRGSIFYNNTEGVKINSTSVTESLVFHNNIFVSNTTAIDSANAKSFDIARCAFYGNTTDIGSNVTIDKDLDRITLTADPFVDAANGDFNLNADAGGGALLRANNYALNTDTSVYPFRQYVSDDFDSGAGGGGATVHPLYAN